MRLDGIYQTDGGFLNCTGLIKDCMDKLQSNVNWEPGNGALLSNLSITVTVHTLESIITST